MPNLPGRTGTQAFIPSSLCIPMNPPRQEEETGQDKPEDILEEGRLNYEPFFWWA